jgi:16S rRNA (guanine966-N2)-methyltransferase
MRITGGSAKGQILKTLPGLAVRPTTDKVREAIFSILQSLPGNWDRGLDLFAGSGALGIEALSRDMEYIDFVDQNGKCCQVIKENLKKTGFTEKSHIYCCPVSRAIGFLDAPYDIIFMDPPYADTTLGSLLESLSGSKLVSADTILLASHATRSPLEKQYNNLSMIKEKKYGDTCISIYHKEVAS